MPFTYTLTSNPGNLFNISGNQLRVNSSSIAPGSYPVTVRADDGLGNIIFQSMMLTATGSGAPAFNFTVTQNSQYVGTLLGGL